MKILGWFCALMAAVCSTGSAATLHVDTFDVASLGWTVPGTLPAQHEPTGGAGDGMGYIRVPSASNLATYNLAADWIGNYTAIGAGRVVVDLRVPEGMPELSIRVVLFGPGSTDQRVTSAVAQIVPADGLWRKYVFSLASGDLVPTQLLNPPLTVSQVMGNVLRAMLRHDTGSPSHGGDGVSGELHIDNAELAAAPIAGDFDGNGTVNGADLSHPTLGWRSRYGTDLDGDDFLVWQRGLNVPVAASVPEPTTLSALSALAVAFISRRRGRRSCDRA